MLLGADSHQKLSFSETSHNVLSSFATIGEGLGSMLFVTLGHKSLGPVIAALGTPKLSKFSPESFQIESSIKVYTSIIILALALALAGCFINSFPSDPSLSCNFK